MEKLKTTELTVTRLIPAKPERVYDVWIDPKHPGGPFYGGTKIILDAKIDGLFYSAIEHEGNTYPHYGRFTRLERGKLVENTWMSPSTKGLESVVTVTFVAKDNGTEVTLVHTNVPDDADGRMHLEGWTYVLDSLKSVLG